jgi:hypothetical protein
MQDKLAATAFHLLPLALAFCAQTNKQTKKKEQTETNDTVAAASRKCFSFACFEHAHISREREIEKQRERRKSQKTK